MPAHESIVQTAVRRFRNPPGHTRADLEQEAWLALVVAEPQYDPARHRCELGAFLVVRIKRHLSELCKRAVRRRMGELPADVAARDMAPVDEVIFNEGLARHGVAG